LSTHEGKLLVPLPKIVADALKRQQALVELATLWRERHLAKAQLAVVKPSRFQE
jgi:hypothetical protein